MKNVRAVKHSVLAFFVNPPGEGRTKGGLITLDDDGENVGIKTRFFEIHDVGSDNDVTHDCKQGDIVAVAHGRWSRGFDVDHPEFLAHGMSFFSTAYRSIHVAKGGMIFYI